MSVWDATTWATVAVLGPGAIIVFLAFVRDVRRLLRDAGREDDGPM
jgi:hypothetical protein